MNRVTTDHNKVENRARSLDLRFKDIKSREVEHYKLFHKLILVWKT